MKLFMKLLLTLLVLAVLAPFTILKDDSGRPLMSFNDLKMPDVVPEIADEIPMQPSAQDVVYQWKDSEGNLHFSSDPPPEGVDYTTRSFDPNTNVIQSVKKKDDSGLLASDTPGTASTDGEGEGEEEDGIGNPYTPQKIEKLFDDAREVQEKLNERYQKQQEILENL